MPKVLCTLDNASTEISGFKFQAVEGGMLSEDLSDEAAEHFLSITGYELAADEEKPAKAVKTPPAAKTAAVKTAPAKKTTTPPPPPADEKPAGDEPPQTPDAPPADEAGDSGAANSEAGDQASSAGKDDPDAVF